MGKGKRGMNIGNKSMAENVIPTQQANELTDIAKDESANDVVSNTMPSSGNKILDALFKNKNNSFNKLVDAVEIAKNANAEEQTIKAEDRDYKNAVSQTLQTLYDKAQSVYSYIGTVSKDQVENDVAKSEQDDIYSSIENPSDTAMERLSVQDYFPDIARDINVGNYSGRRVGSVSIFAAPGMTIPFGMLDARKRALAQAAQKKSAMMQKIQELPNAPDQFNIGFKQYAHSKISAFNEKHNYDPQAFMRDKEAMAELYRLQTTAKAMIDVDTEFDRLLTNRVDKDGKPAYYIPEELLKQMYDFQSGKLENMEDYFSGKKNVSELLRNARNYGDGTRMVDSRIAELLKYPQQLPMSVKKGVTITEDNIKELKSAREKAVATGSYDSYVTALKKFYEIDVDGIVDPWMDNAGYAKDDPARQWIRDYFKAQIPKESVEAKWTDVANRNFDYYKFGKELEYKKEQDRSYWETVRNKFDEVETQKSISSIQSSLSNIDNRIKEINSDPSISAESKKQKIDYWREKKAGILADAYNSIPGFGALGFKVQRDPNNPDRVYGISAITGQERNKGVTFANKEVGVYVFDPSVAGDKGKWVSFEELKNHMIIKNQYDEDGNVIPNSQTITYKKGFTPVTRGTGAAGNEFDADMIKVIQDSRIGSVTASAYEHQIEAGYGSGGNKYAVNTNNVQYYNNADEKMVMVTTRLNPIIYDQKGNAKPSKVRLTVQSDLKSFTELETLEVLSGTRDLTKDKFEGDE